MIAKTLIFIRHGKTEYTGQFPDLTPEGIDQIGHAANEISGIVGGREDILMVSSPLPRALGSADIIARRLGYRPDNIEMELAIRCMDFYDNEGASALWSSFGTARGVDHAYARDPQFESGSVVEKRSAIQHRFWTYLGSLFERFVAGKLPDVVIHTSHFEVLWHLAASFGHKEPLIHGEVLKLDLTDSGSFVGVEMTFRGQDRIVHASLPTELFSDQFEARLIPGW